MQPLLLSALLCAASATTAQADIVVRFADGAPKDRFTIINTAACATGPLAVTLDLIGSPAGLIFDVTGDGAGVEVFQPFELTAGADMVDGVGEVADGDQILTLLMSQMEAGAEVSFTIDVDDTAGTREITVTGSEIAGALAMVTTDTVLSDAVFDGSGQAQIPLASCTS